MALTEDGSNMVMPVSPMYGGYGNNGFGFGGDWSAWIVLLLLFGMGGFGGWGMGGFGGGFEFPWLLTGQQNINSNTNAGFDNLGLQNQLTGIQNSLNSAEVANCNRAMDAMQTAYNNQISGLERSFASQTATMQGMNDIQSQIAKCCCDNQLATVQTQNVVQTEAAATRAAGVADTQKILDKLCQLELDGVKAQVEAKNDRIAELQTQLNMANLAASQAAQTAQLVADNTAQTQYIVNRVAPYPIPAYPVNNPFGCNGYNFGYNG